MLRSLIAHVLFCFALVSICHWSAQAARAEVPFEGWLSVAADSLDHQISAQREQSWQTVNLLGQHAVDKFDYLVGQCRLGFGGKRGSQLVSAIDLLEQLRDSGVTGVVAPKKNWIFPVENYQILGSPLVQGELERRQFHELKAAASKINRPIADRFALIMGQGRAAIQFAGHAKETLGQVRKAVYRPAEPIIDAAGRGWDEWMTLSYGMPAEPSHTEESAQPEQGQAERVSVKQIGESLDTYWENYRTCDRWEAVPASGSAISESSSDSPFDSEGITGGGSDLLLTYWSEVSHSALAKLNWLTSKVRQFGEACLKSVEPQFLILEFQSVESSSPSAPIEPIHSSVAELPHSTR